MSKAEEIEILEQAVDRLGTDSYCGAALRELIPSMERDMRSDLCPTPMAEIGAARVALAEIIDLVGAEMSKLSKANAAIMRSESTLRYLDKQMAEMADIANGLAKMANSGASWS
tara:strand:+ start:10967 stop:11308 length:342 start_codon:yes stop_codon:yes gene_type:complete